MYTIVTKFVQLPGHPITFEMMNFSDELIRWYLTNKRDLPWRNTTDAYVIWLSEIILQQTRVEQGLPYFYRFIENVKINKELLLQPRVDSDGCINITADIKMCSML